MKLRLAKKVLNKKRTRGSTKKKAVKRYGLWYRRWT